MDTSSSSSKRAGQSSTIKFYHRIVIYLVLLNIFLIFWNSKQSIINSMQVSKKAEINAMKLNVTNKFIVVTSILQPTPAVKRLAQQDGWTLIAVADRKTPKTWFHPNVHYLSVEDQLRLNYSVLELVPFDSYTRKMIGYLYAIERGAEWIYDTDDDNQPFGKGLEQFDYEDEISGLVFRTHSNKSTACANLFQPYTFYGRPDIWPRGFPLQCIKKCDNNNGIYEICKRLPVPAIQQGIVHKDPDVDALFRLLNADETDGLNVSFNPYASAVSLAPGVFAPLNSQNTLFHRSAFFTMWLPVSVAFRVTDIWRSYFAQKLMHLIGRSVAFYPVNAVQYRNVHDFIKDYKDEKSLYEDAHRLIQFLEDWQCPHTNIGDCSIALAEQFAKNGFWSSLDVEICKRWIVDVQKLGYSFPALAASIDLDRAYNVYNVSSYKMDRFKNCHSAKISFRPVFELRDLQHDYEARAINAYRELDDWCAEKLRTTQNYTLYPNPQILHDALMQTMLAKYRNMVLIITFNTVMRGSQISILQRIYEPFFAVTIYCGTVNANFRVISSSFPELKSPVNFVDISQRELMQGIFGYYCATKVLEMRLQNIEATLNNVQKLVRIMFDNEFVTGTSFQANEKVVVQLPKVLGWRNGDFYYIPGDAISVRIFYVLTELMYEGMVFHEIVMSKLAEGVKIQSNGFLTLWNDNRSKWYHRYSEQLLMLHPVKLLREANNLTHVCLLIGRFKTKLFFVDI